MKITRTANAGVLLELDNSLILLDGVCNEVFPYLKTPDNIREELTVNFPDIVAYTHKHDDHYDEAYLKKYKEATLRPVYGSEFVCSVEVGNTGLQGISTRHIGKSDIPHVSFIITGSRCVWFMGDASPLVWRNADNFPIPDVVIAPYAYAVTESAWKITKGLGAKDIVLLHLPERENDSYKLWDAVEATTKNDSCVHIPSLGESIFLL